MLSMQYVIYFENSIFFVLNINEVFFWVFFMLLQKKENVKPVAKKIAVTLLPFFFDTHILHPF